jgi:hypothetical protein
MDSGTRNTGGHFDRGEQTCKTPIDLSRGNHVRVRRSWRMPLAGHSGVVSAIEPNDPCGTYLIQFEGGLQFRYERRDLELMVAPSIVHERLVRALLRFDRSLRAWTCSIIWNIPIKKNTTLTVPVPVCGIQSRRFKRGSHTSDRGTWLP